MALTTDQKHDCVRLLRWPGTVLISTSLSYNNIIVGRLDNLNASIETDVVTLLTRVSTLDTLLNSALSRVAVKEIDGVQLNPQEMETLRSERKRVIRELSELLEIPIYGGSSNMVGVMV